MYAIDWSALRIGAPRDGQARSRWVPIVHRTVWALGFTSLFTDVSSEMVASILPMYLVVQLGMQPYAFGLIDGLYQGAAALVRVAGGVLGDRWRRHKEIATVGYGLSAACRVAMLLAGSTWGVIAGVIAVDRTGKGLRTAPRDALITLRTPPQDLAMAFGVHRGLDAAGAMFGPLVAFLILAASPGRFDILFAASFVAAVIGVAIIILFVEPVMDRAHAASVPRLRAAFDLLGLPRFRAIVIAGLLLGLPTVSDGFIFLSLQRKAGIAVTAFPLFFVVTSLFTALCSAPFGRLADRVGRQRVLLAGYVLLAVTYVSLLLPGSSLVAAIVPLALLGAYYAATDGVLTAMAATVLPAQTTGSGLSLLATATNVSRILASVLFGVLWTFAGVNTATGIYLVALSIAIAGTGVVLKVLNVPAGAGGAGANGANSANGANGANGAAHPS
jgi:MFS family permease